MARRNQTFARQRACDGREVPKIAHYFPTAARMFEFPHSQQDLCTRIDTLIQNSFFGAKVMCGKIASSRRVHDHGPDGTSDN